MKNVVGIALALIFLSGCDIWVDNDKTGPKDGNMCWVASASNLIEAKTGQENVFEFLKNNLKNEAGHPAKLLRILGFNPLSKNFEIESFRADLKSYKALSVTFGSETQARHAITVWCMVGSTLIITDSDDGYHGLVARQIIDGKLDGVYKIYRYVGI